jgi:hypothetical protein
VRLRNLNAEEDTAEIWAVVPYEIKTTYSTSWLTTCLPLRLRRLFDISR